MSPAQDERDSVWTTTLERDAAGAWRRLRGLMQMAPLRAMGVAVALAAGVPVAEAGGRVLTAMDVVAVKVLNEPDLDTTTRVAPDGTINFPYVGRIKAAGRTEDDLARAIEKRLIELQILPGPP